MATPETAVAVKAETDSTERQPVSVEAPQVPVQVDATIKPNAQTTGTRKRKAAETAPKRARKSSQGQEQRSASSSTATDDDEPKPATATTTSKRGQGATRGRTGRKPADPEDQEDAETPASPRGTGGMPPSGMCAVLTTSLAFTLKQVSEFCRVCCINVVPIHLDRTNGLSIAFGDATARMTVRITLPPAFFDAFQIREDEVVLGVEAGEFANICRRIKRRDSAAVYVDDRRENFSVAVRFGDRHINALDTKVSPTQVVLHELPLDQYAQAGVQPLCATMGTLHRAIKNMRTRTDRVHVRGRVSRWVEFSYTNETNTKSRDCFYAKGCSNSDLNEPVDYSYNVLVAHLSRALRMILLGPVSHLYLGPNLPLRISTPVPDSCGGCAEFVLAASP